MYNTNLALGKYKRLIMVKTYELPSARTLINLDDYSNWSRSRVAAYKVTQTTLIHKQRQNAIVAPKSCKIVSGGSEWLAFTAYIYLNHTRAPTSTHRTIHIYLFALHS